MRRRFSFLFSKGRRGKPLRSDPEGGEGAMDCGLSPDENGGANKDTEYTVSNSQSGRKDNIIMNPNFSEGLSSWHPNSCEAHVISGQPGNHSGIADTKDRYAVVTKRTDTWQGLEQDITGKVSPGNEYVASAIVKVGGAVQGPASIQATVRVDYDDSPTDYIFVGRVPASHEQWEILDGSFSVPRMGRQIIFYLEGPPAGVDLLINLVTVFSPSICQHEDQNSYNIDDGDHNIIQNPHFEDGLNDWSARGCNFFVCDSMGNGMVLPVTGNNFVSTSHRTQSWNGIQQEITGKVQRKLAYDVIAIVRAFGSSANVDIRATLYTQAPNGREQYIGIASMQASDKEWVQLQGKFLLNGIHSKAVIYLEGPPPGTDILLNSLIVKRAEKLPPAPPPDIEVAGGMMAAREDDLSSNVISNYDFSKGLYSWHSNRCDWRVVSGESFQKEGASAKSGWSYAIVTDRRECWHGLEQEITAKISAGSTYVVSTWVRVRRTQEEVTQVKATLKLENRDSSTSYVPIGSTLATTFQWAKLEGHFLLTSMPKRAIFYLEGPPPGVDLLVDSVKISSQKSQKAFLGGTNLICNSSLVEGLNGWYPLGSCNLKVCIGSPHLLPPAAKESLGQHEPLNGYYILTTDRTETWMGPAQTLTDRLKLHVTYQVSAWVRVGYGAHGPQNVNLALGVDESWINAGLVEANTDRWSELAGSFRIEKQPSKVIAYVQGPSPGVDLMVAGLNIFPVDRKARFSYLKKQTDKARKRDVVLKFSGSDSFGRTVTVHQLSNSFPFGSCINRSNIDNEEFVDFFLKNFSWAVFGNELKWYHTEPQPGKFNYADADEMLDFCKRHDKKIRGHCIFWEADGIQPWVQSLNSVDLMTAIQNRLTGLFSRYKGHFCHYDVNNEMLHGTFYQDKLGTDIRAYMFKAVHELDPSATLFVNDYHVEDGCDSKSSPEMYIQQILDLKERGAPIGGIGIQGHIDHPVGPIICSALDKLAILGLPIWFTELDVSAENEHIRADDLEVMLREAYAHPAVEGIMLWGFWEMFMCRDCSHLINAEGDINEAGRRYLDLRQEWMTNIEATVDETMEFKFRGFHGTYSVEVETPSGKYLQTFTVDKGDCPVSLTIALV